MGETARQALTGLGAILIVILVAASCAVLTHEPNECDSSSICAGPGPAPR